MEFKLKELTVRDLVKDYRDHDEFVSIMKEYRKSKDKKNETMAYFRAINDNINTLKNML